MAKHSTILAQLGVYDGFDPVVLSYEEGPTKDYPRIFDLALERMGTARDRTLFIDDVERFARSAKAAGLRAIVFQDFERLRSRQRCDRCADTRRAKLEGPRPEAPERPDHGHDLH
jgi:FMN phosphatase YigB (HAD superfamily)